MLLWQPSKPTVDLPRGIHPTPLLEKDSLVYFHYKNFSFQHEFDFFMVQKSYLKA